MSSSKFSKKAVVLAALAALADAGASGSGKTTRYWDCCKPSCAWSGKSNAITNPVGTCDISDKPLSDVNAGNACTGGNAYMCSSQSPWAVNDTMAYGFAAVNIAGGTEASWCCACYKLTFTSTSIAGKTMIVQATNTGGDLGSNQFDLAMPGGGVGIYNGCTAEWGAPPSGWGAQYGGVSSASACASFPAALQPGCNFRFGWFGGADNPAVNFEQVACPAELTAKTGCRRTDDGSAAGSGSSGSTTSKPVSSAAKLATTSSSKKSTTLVTTTTPAPGGAGVQTKWGQCGGSGWTGPTACAPGSSCKVGNPWYSQCL